MKRKTLALLGLVALVAVGGLAIAATFSAPQSGEVTLNATDGPAVTVNGQTESDLTSPFPDSNTVNWTTKDGIAEFSSNGPTEAYVDVSELEGSWTNVSQIDATGADLTIDPQDKSAATVGGGVTELSYRQDSDTGVDDSVDFVYSAGSSGSVTLRSFSPNTAYWAITPSGSQIDSGTTDANGHTTISVNSATDQEVVVYSASSPNIDNSSADPPDGAGLQDHDETYTINISDADFDPYGDTVVAELYIDGEKRGQDTITSNGTANVSASITEGGNHTYWWRTTDDYGFEQNSSKFDIQVPDQIFIYDETDPGKLLDNVTVELEFYIQSGSNQIVTRSTSDGAINMTGLPADQPVIVDARASGYQPRRIFVSSLFETQAIYMLPDSEPHVEATIELTDYSGDFPEEDTVLEIQRNLNGSWGTVEGDFFGATGEFMATLAESQRHRLILHNLETGETRDVGTFQPLSSGRYEVQVDPGGEVDVLGPGVSVDIDPSFGSVSARNETNVTVDIDPLTRELNSYTVTIQKLSGSNTSDSTQVFKTTGSNPDGEKIVATLNLSGSAGDSLYVTVTWEDSNSNTGVETQNIQISETFENEYSVVSTAGWIQTLIPEGNWAAFSTMLSLILTLVVTGTVTKKLRLGSEMAGLTALGTLSAFAAFKWFPWPIVLAGAVALVALAAIRRGL